MPTDETTYYSHDRYCEHLCHDDPFEAAQDAWENEDVEGDTIELHVFKRSVITTEIAKRYVGGMFEQISEEYDGPDRDSTGGSDQRITAAADALAEAIYQHWDVWRCDWVRSETYEVMIVDNILEDVKLRTVLRPPRSNR